MSQPTFLPFSRPKLGGGFKYFFFSPLPGEMFQFDKYCSNGLKPPTSKTETTDTRCLQSGRLIQNHLLKTGKDSKKSWVGISPFFVKKMPGAHEISRSLGPLLVSTTFHFLTAALPFHWQRHTSPDASGRSCGHRGGFCDIEM